MVLHLHVPAVSAQQKNPTVLVLQLRAFSSAGPSTDKFIRCYSRKRFCQPDDNMRKVLSIVV